jgi:MinD superfamily P-loop ATPase
MKITIGSGKGGTGKTTVAVALALSLAQEGISANYLDCDVEEPNGHIFLKPGHLEQRSVNVPLPVIDFTKCTLCGKCAKFCAFNALAALPKTVLVFKEMCHGCGGCTIICPEKAVNEKSREIGTIKTGTARSVYICYGEINIGEARAAPLIKAVKSHASPEAVNIIDAPPGTACPFVESVKDTDFCILVTEPTPFGLFDLKLAVEVVKVFKIPFGIIINRDGIGDSGVKDFCRENGIPVLMSIPHDRKIAVAYSEGKNLLEAVPEFKNKFVELYRNIDERTGHNKR